MKRILITGVANYIEWVNEARPDKVYISDFIGGVLHGPRPMPLASPTNRVLGLLWGPMTLNPGESFSFTIAVGMADIHPKTGMPIKPKTDFKRWHSKHFITLPPPADPPR